MCVSTALLLFYIINMLKDWASYCIKYPTSWICLIASFWHPNSLYVVPCTYCVLYLKFDPELCVRFRGIIGESTLSLCYERPCESVGVGGATWAVAKIDLCNLQVACSPQLSCFSLLYLVMSYFFFHLFCLLIDQLIDWLIEGGMCVGYKTTFGTWFSPSSL